MGLTKKIMKRVREACPELDVKQEDTIMCVIDEMACWDFLEGLIEDNGFEEIVDLLEIFGKDEE